MTNNQRAFDFSTSVFYDTNYSTTSMTKTISIVNSQKIAVILHTKSS